jgi:hypothetical protein
MIQENSRITAVYVGIYCYFVLERRISNGVFMFTVTAQFT